jgi:hypothetical protein
MTKLAPVSMHPFADRVHNLALDKPIRFVLVGLGFWGRPWAKILKTHPWVMTAVALQYPGYLPFGCASG